MPPYCERRRPGDDYPDVVTGLRYLSSRGSDGSDLALDDQRFAALRDEFVVGFRYHTARAYAADLDHLFGWAKSADLDVVDLTVADIERYVAALTSQRYSANTMVRKRTALRGFYALAAHAHARASSPMSGWPWRRRSSPAAQPT
jgi:site-specific recombinase XerC